jgi:ribosomal protein S2
MRRFLTGLLTDESLVARDIRAFELAARTLETWLKVEVEPEELETRTSRRKLQRRLGTYAPHIY